jgi:hypothetical protein
MSRIHNELNNLELLDISSMEDKCNRLAAAGIKNANWAFNCILRSDLVRPLALGLMQRSTQETLQWYEDIVFLNTPRMILRARNAENLTILLPRLFCNLTDFDHKCPRWGADKYGYTGKRRTKKEE